MLLKKYKWHKVAEAAASATDSTTPSISDGTLPTSLKFSPGDIALVEVEGKKICIAQHDQGYYGFSHSCPHAGGLMEEGYLDGVGNVVCPIHHYKFSLRNGRNSSGEGYKLKTYPVESRPDGIFVGIEEGGLFGWL